MRSLFKPISLFLLASCIDKPVKDKSFVVPDNSKLVITALRDSLGTVSFSIPIQYGTSFTWTNHSDCGKPCDHEQYRFQAKSFPNFKESGFYYDIPNIPIDQFTIIHSGYFPFHDGVDTSMNLGRHENFKSRLSSDQYNGIVVSDTIEKINDRYFSVVYLNGYDKQRQKYIAKVAALTTIKGNEIEFHYDIKTKDTIDTRRFFDNSKRLIRTIRMSNGI